MRRHLLLGLVALAALALAGNLLAQGSPVQVPPGTPTSSLNGTVVAVSASELVIETPSGRQRFIVDSNSTLPANLAAGTRVSVEYHRLEGDRRHVARVTTAAPAPPRADAPPMLDDPMLPRTASPLLIVGALGLASLLASKALQIANQGH
ncbi:MAG TPA: hypothetical protein VFC77_09550 [Myxococcota bacterium]|nr:hypothetical protein [Myxococcota bacterium]